MKAKRKAAKRKRKPRKFKLPPIVHVETQEPVITHQEPVIERRGPGPGKFLPEDEPLPDAYYRRQRPVCPRCRCVALSSSGGQAVVCVHTGEDIAYFRCKECGHRFQLPIRKG